MGGGKSASKAASREAERARADEEARQTRIREGTNRINSIFDNGGAGAKLSGDVGYDANRTYYNADGSVWTPQATQAAAPQQPSRQPNFETESGFWTDQVRPAANAAPAQTKTAEEQFREAIAAGNLHDKGEGGFGEDFFAGRRKAFMDHATPQLDDQYGKAQKELTFSLARSGLLDSSTRASKAGELQKTNDLARQQIADQAIASEGQARNAVEDARSNLIATLNATGDQQGATNSALARASALSQPDAFSPIGNMFADFTGALGQQAALERANAYSGGQVKSRYNTGLFGTNSSMVVK